MSFDPVAPAARVAPQLIAPDTWLIHQVAPALGAPLSVYINSMVITGQEPVVVDTGTIANRAQWLEDAFGVVAPEDVRWVFLSHDDVDHTGNLAEVMTACPNATLVASWTLVERFTNAFNFPLERTRWLNDGESFDAGDRTLRAVRPPVWDSPTTRGLFDTKTGVYWAVDAFASPMPSTPVRTVADLDPILWKDGIVMFGHHALAPWLSLVDRERFSDLCDRIQVLGMRTIASAHSPLIESESVVEAFALLREMPGITPPELPDQEVLDAILAKVSLA